MTNRELKQLQMLLGKLKKQRPDLTVVVTDTPCEDRPDAGVAFPECNVLFTDLHCLVDFCLDDETNESLGPRNDYV